MTLLLYLDYNATTPVAPEVAVRLSIGAPLGPTDNNIERKQKCYVSTSPFSRC
jgi:hypothetical protein